MCAVHEFNPALLDVLACPQDHLPLHLDNGCLVCAENHRFPIENGIPIFAATPRREAIPHNMPSLEPDGRTLSSSTNLVEDTIDPFVNDWIVNTNGNLYWRARGRLRRYPIPAPPFEASPGKPKLLVDIGCSWGRWSIAAWRAGFHTIGVDVHLDALAAAYRVSRQLGAGGDFLCADAEAFPLAAASADCVFSYSVLQHLERETVKRIFCEAARILKPGGILLVQLPNSRGPASMLQQAKRGFREARVGTFEMRYWSRAEILSALRRAGFGNATVRADGFFTQNSQLADLDLLSPAGKLVVLASHAACAATKRLPILARFADSLWIEARRVPS